jgi:hypothetical protein
MENITNTLLFLLVAFMFSCTSDNEQEEIVFDNKSIFDTSDTLQKPIEKENEQTKENTITEKELDALKQKYDYIKATFVDFSFGDLEHYTFVSKYNEVFNFQLNNSQYDFAMDLPKEEANMDNQGWGTDPEYIGRTFHIFYDRQYNEMYQFHMNVIQKLVLTEDSVRKIDMEELYKGELTDYKFKLMEEQAIIQYKDLSYSETMSVAEGFNMLESNQTLYLNTLVVKDQQPIILSNLENIQIFSYDAQYETNQDKPVLSLINVNNARISGVKFMHKKEGTQHNNNSVEIIQSNNIVFKECAFNGDGEFSKHGVLISNSNTVLIKNSKFKLCTYGLAALNSKNISIKQNIFSEIRKHQIKDGDSPQFKQYKYKINDTEKVVDHYICYKNETDPESSIMLSFTAYGNALEVKYKGKEDIMDLEYINEDEPEYQSTTSVKYYNELYKGKVNGTYIVTRSGNWSDVVYTRGNDGNIFSFSIDHEANPYGKSPCF